METASAPSRMVRFSSNLGFLLDTKNMSGGCVQLCRVAIKHSLSLFAADFAGKDMVGV